MKGKPIFSKNLNLFGVFMVQWAIGLNSKREGQKFESGERKTFFFISPKNLNFSCFGGAVTMGLISEKKNIKTSDP